jgi:ferric-dicitrate binding protein FerR (iron transport regulator)
MTVIFSVDELVINDSFINFCFNENPEDYKFWQQYILEHPAEHQTLREAKRRIYMLHEMTSKKNKEISQYIEPAFGSKIRYGHFNTLIRIVAVLVLLFSGIAVFLFISGRKQKSNSFVEISSIKSYKTSPGEKSVFILPDRSKVILNSASELVLTPAFGKTERSVTLTGEAFFEVTHNKDIPFLVNTNRFQIKVLGTKFNVKSYPNEQNETTLIQGSIELHLNNSAKKAVRLRPDEKLIVGKNYYPHQNKVMQQNIDKSSEVVKIEPVKKPDGNVEKIHETAWIQNRLVIDNQSFSSLELMLERWFNINIVFKDEESKEYVFTATFENETPEEVFSALQLSYPFHFSIENKTIYVSR